MREIKFRAWGMREKKYLAEGFHIFGETTCFNLVGQQLDIQPGESTILRINDVIIEQFTGLLDKNGREIYEGDIVQCSDAAFYRIVTYLTIRASFFFVHRDSWYPAAVATTSHAETVVVGNIHENPELLS